MLIATVLTAVLAAAPQAAPAASSTSMSVTASAAASSDVAQVAEGDGEELGFMDTYFPFSYADNLSPEVEDKKVMAHLLMIVTAPLCGSIWIPMVIYGGSPGDYLSESVISWFVHFAATFIPVAGPFIGLANCFYLIPVASTNAWDRNNRKANKTSKAGLMPAKPNAVALAQAPPAMAY